MILRPISFGHRLFGYAYIVYRMSANTIKLLRKFHHQRVCFGDRWDGNVSVHMMFEEDDA